MKTTEEKLEKIFNKYKGTENELIPLLQDIQDVFGYLPSDVMKQIASFLAIPEASVYGVATFYSQFNLTRQGKHNIRVCMGTACYVRGSQQIIDRIEQKLGIKPGETTKDYTFSVESIACFGSCALAPVVFIDGKVYGRMTPDKVIKVLENLK